MTAKTLLRGGCVLTLGAKSPNHAKADVLIEDGTVVEVGSGLRARDAEHVDATDTIVMPGFVDAHRHVWTSLFRNLGERTPSGGIDLFGPEDVYAATLIGLLGAIEAGITTVVDWSDLPLEGGAAEAALQAHADAGLRTVFVHAAREGDVRGGLARLREAAGPATTIALGSSGLAAESLDRLAADWALARELGLPIHAHASETAAPGEIARLAERGLLGQDVTLVHGSGLGAADLDAVSASGVALTLTPSSEMAGGRGSPPIQHLIDRDIRPALGVDDERVAPGDMFAQMRATISLQRATVFDLKLAGKAGLPKLMSTRDAIRYATGDGARAAGLRGITGSLEPGMRADVIVLRTDRPNIFPINDPIGAVVWGMDTSNVDRVLAGGRVLMRDGVLQADAQRARGLTMAARDRVATAAGIAAGIAAGNER